MKMYCLLEISLTLSRKLALMTVCGEVHASLEFIVYWKSLTLSRKLALMTVCREILESSMLDENVLFIRNKFNFIKKISSDDCM